MPYPVLFTFIHIHYSYVSLVQHHKHVSNSITCIYQSIRNILIEIHCKFHAVA